MTPRLVYVFGVPGAGKSTAVAAATAHWHRETAPRIKGLPAHQYLLDAAHRLVAVELGDYRPPFSGTDTLSMSCQRSVLDLLGSHPCPLVIGEGDRLASAAFFGQVQAVGWQVQPVWWQVPDQVAAVQREQRAQANGLRGQSASWLAGRATKVANLAAALPNVHTLDGTHPGAVQQLRSLIDGAP